MEINSYLQRRRRRNALASYYQALRTSNYGIISACAPKSDGVRRKSLGNPRPPHMAPSALTSRLVPLLMMPYRSSGGPLLLLLHVPERLLPSRRLSVDTALRH